MSTEANVLISGSSGRLGTLLREELPEAYCSTFRLEDTKEVEKVIKKVKPKVVYHLAGIWKGSRREFYQINKDATINLYNICMDNGVEKFIFTSSCAVYDQKVLKAYKETENVNPQSDYGTSKALAEMGIPEATILRIFNIYGKTFETSLINKMLTSTDENKVPILIPDTYFRDYIYCDEAIKFLLKAREVKKGTYNLGAGRAIATAELLDRIKPHYDLVPSKMEYSISWADMSKTEKKIKIKPSQELIL